MMNDYLVTLVLAKQLPDFSSKGRCTQKHQKHLHILEITLDSSGCIIQSECECVAGKGPNAVCKHIATLCYAF